MDHELGCYVELFASEEECRFHMKYFGDLLPSLTHAFERSYPRGRLTKRESVVLELRAKGHQVMPLPISWTSPRKSKCILKPSRRSSPMTSSRVVIALKLGMIE